MLYYNIFYVRFGVYDCAYARVCTTLVHARALSQSVLTRELRTYEYWKGDKHRFKV